ncbi:probable inactive receptor kinase At2g26730, partial [Olea europaea subsp. europaea]
MGSVEIGGINWYSSNAGAYSFNLKDLLTASTRKKSDGTSYEAVLEEGGIVLVKRLKDVVASKKEFEQQMEVLEKIKHENVLPLRCGGGS